MKHELTYDMKLARQQIAKLVQQYEAEKSSLEKTNYKEAQLRTDYINPLLRSLGWDVGNEEGRSQLYRTVVEEETIEVEEGDHIRKKNPDYTLQVLGKRELFYEIKKASLNIEDLQSAAFQTRRYGWSAKLGVSVLTNFRQLIIYDCRYKPSVEDAAHIARYKTFSVEDYTERFDEIYGLLSFNAVSSGIIDELFSYEKHDSIPFDHYFLSQINDWRVELATNIISQIELDEESLNLLVQRLINRIVFLRICEDRELEMFERLKSVSSYEELKAIFQESDAKYNSGLFDFVEDRLTFDIKIDTEILLSIFTNLYYPLSPYDFSVVDSAILSQIYEEFLGKKLKVSEGEVALYDEPEVAASSGVVPTPRLIVERIIEETIEPLIRDKDEGELLSLRIIDICCGSGSFLIQLFEYLQDVYFKVLGELTLEKKRQILLANIFGVDINPYATEVTRFSLLLKLLEGESNLTVESSLASSPNGVLPNLADNIFNGNSLVGFDYYEFDQNAITDIELGRKIRPFDFNEAFPFLNDVFGFDAVIGNPPYVRIQNLVKYSKEEIAFYRAKGFKYNVASKENFDKYFLFVEQGVKLLNDTGRLGYILPNRFFILKSGERLRKYITENTWLSRIIHFGVSQVFPGRSTYTAILVLGKILTENFIFDRVKNISPAGFFNPVTRIEYSTSTYDRNPWVFLSYEALTVLEKIYESSTVPLGEIADITVGLQTSADPIYILTDYKEAGDYIQFTKEGQNWKVEKAVTRPCFYDLSFSLFDTPKANALMIYPYILDGDTARVYSEHEMEEHFPACYNYFQHYREELEKRSISGGKKEDLIWYQYGRSQSLTKFIGQDKLIWSVLSTDAPYAFDQQSTLFTGGGNGPYYGLLPKQNQYSLLYILGILSFPVIESLVKSRASEFRGSYYSHGKQFMVHLPIPVIDFDDDASKNNHDSIVNIVEQLIVLNARRNAQRIGKNSQIDGAYHFVLGKLFSTIRKLYGISEQEQEVMIKNLFAVEQSTDE
jgi:type I restriction-modification system DNA methylase subunit